MRDWTTQARIYWAAMIAAGAVVLCHSLWGWQPARSEHLGQFVFYVLASMAVSNMKVTLPGITSTMSVNFLFILVGITELSLAETLIVGVLSTLTQCLIRARLHPKWEQLLFNSFYMAVPICVCHNLMHLRAIHGVDKSDLLPLFLATICYYLMNTGAIAGIIASTERKNVYRVWFDSFFWTAPQYLVGGALAECIHFGNRFLGWQGSLMGLPIIYLVYRSYTLYLGRLEEKTTHVSEMADLHLRTIEALALAIDAKDETTHDHLRRVQVYATEIGRELHLSDIDIQALQAGALLHDIGKLAVPEHIISKPGRLTPAEFDKMKIHPVVGAEILERVKFPYPVVPIVRSHHEKFDGSGYPDGLKGEEIPIGARVLAVVDCLDALATDRQYRRALPLEEAMKEVIRGSGTSFDPKIVEILVRRFAELEQMAVASHVEGSKLSTNTKIEGGHAPAVGFENTHELQSQGPGSNFTMSIASARQEFQMLLEITNDLGNSLSVDETLSLLAVRLKKMVPHDSIAIYVCSEGNLLPQFVGGENFRLFSGLQIPIGQGLSGWVAENRRPIVNGNPTVEPGYLNDAGVMTTLRSAISVPLEGIDGVVGVLTLYHARADAFTQDHLRILLAISSKAGLTLENALRFKQVESSSVTDELTGLPNARSLFLHLDSELARCKRLNTELAVLVLDLDGFKQVNDSFGHLTGNKVLELTARGLRDVCREYDYVARMGGDEFVVVLPAIDLEMVEIIVGRLEDVAVKVGFQVCGKKILSLSIGQAFYPGDGVDAEKLLAEADRKMYQAKGLHHSNLRALAALEKLPVETLAIQ
ncbi:MAG: diguanylate cyclase [Bryobacteraceae bacterium]